ncbi:tyrosine-type recombinase/integrase [Clostridium perfringens]|uniref:Tyrosine-type recombinase/integrase n=2 Tax=Clostridium perfringens TaxID=1502 RepID=A0AAP7BWX2_CLOPF|nr:tyrosine-type recombinase/integrase [Clostridium perfringens]EDT23579.1 putative integrase/recombinase [Clostridium perfringens B str. ATCC 3626]MCX0366283.1 tyrosine-type recombinase/integrase [Clostridium perfringens]NGU31431.1 tyrosine-type recombinase/integrase [Clostridium perfringens]WEV05464.1 tyrosine-type recombinase/integrase [Clostridium perfringens B]
MNNIKLNEFIRYEFDRGLTLETTKRYEREIKCFLKFIKIKTDKELSDLLEDEIKMCLKKYKMNLEKEKYKPSTINGKIIIINKFLRFCEIEVKEKCVKIQKKPYITNVLSESEYLRLLNVCDNFRDKVIIRVLANTGLRVSELLSLEIREIYNGDIQIKGKGAKYRECFCSSEIIKLIKQYIETERLGTDKSKVFTGRKGALKRQAINKMLFKYAKKAHIKKEKAHPHSLRHLFGKNLAERRVSLDVIKTFMGHEDIRTTAIYTKRTREELVDTLELNII